MNHILIPEDGLQPRVAQLWRSVYDPVLLEALLQQKNKTHFGQAHGTPFTKDILRQIPFSGTGPITDKILNGTLHVQDPIVQLVLDNLKRPTGLLVIRPHITLDEVTGKFDNWKETTSTLPITKRHLGHYQCLTKIIDTEDSEESSDAV